MKTIFLVLFLAAACAGYSQAGSDQPPYKRFPDNLPLKLLLTDSATTFTRADLDKKKAVMIMIFSPDCEHCQHETEEIIKNIDKFSQVQIVMATMLPFDKMKEFYKHYELSRFNNIVVGKDGRYQLPVYYNIRSLPFLAFYDKNKKLIDVFEGNLPMDKVLAKFQ